MYLLSLLFLLIMFTCDLLCAQSIEEEMNKLRELLGVSASTSIIPSTSALPEINPLKVYLALDQDGDVRRGFVKRISEWNEKKGPTI